MMKQYAIKVWAGVPDDYLDKWSNTRVVHQSVLAALSPDAARRSARLRFVHGVFDNDERQEKVKIPAGLTFWKVTAQPISPAAAAEQSGVKPLFPLDGE